MFELILTMVLNNQVAAQAPIDNIRFSNMAACENYKTRKSYSDSEILRFKCLKKKS